MNLEFDTITISKPLMLIGAADFLDFWIVKNPLDECITVHPNVRDKSKTDKFGYLFRLGEISSGQIKLFETDIEKEGSFSEAWEDYNLVMHPASPFAISGLKNLPKELFEPSNHGNRIVLYSVNQIQLVLACYTHSALGRHITAGHNKTYFDIANILRLKFSSLPLPKNAIAKPLDWIEGQLFGLTRKQVA